MRHIWVNLGIDELVEKGYVTTVHDLRWSVSALGTGVGGEGQDLASPGLLQTNVPR